MLGVITMAGATIVVDVTGGAVDVQGMLAIMPFANAICDTGIKFGAGVTVNHRTKTAAGGNVFKMAAVVGDGV